MKRVVVLTCLFVSCLHALSADWPTYRHDIARSGITAEELRMPLAPCWTFQPLHAPRCAWGEPNPRPVGGWFAQTEGRRVQFDDAFHAVVAGGLLFFGSSADGCVYALDAATGRLRWSFITGGPVRLAPTAVGDRIYVGSDDGWVYCLRVADGAEVWKYHAAPGDEQLLGSGQMISRWPVRTGVLVDGDVAYFGAGVFPAEGVFVHAVDARTGQRLWCNDARGAPPQSRFSPQGYLVASSTALYVPTGRVSPAALNRGDGRLLYEAYFEHSIGGTYTVLVGDHIFTGTNEILGYHRNSRAPLAWFLGKRIIVAGKRYYIATGRELHAFDRATYPAISLKRKRLRDRQNRERGKGQLAVRNVRACLDTVAKSRKSVGEKERTVEQAGANVSDAQRKELEQARRKLASDKQNLAKALGHPDYVSWQTLIADIKAADEAIASVTPWRCETPCADALIMAGPVLYAGGKGAFIAVDSADGKTLWETKVDGRARGLAVADGRLFVGTDTGGIHCFGTGQGAATVVRQPVEPDPFPRDELTPVFAAAVKRILASSGVNKGYACVLGSGTGRLAYELAKRTELVVYGVETNRANVTSARRALQATGLLGTRVRIDPVDPSASTPLPYPDYFANLVVSETALLNGTLPCLAADAYRITRPLGGKICIGTPTRVGKTLRPISRAMLQAWAGSAPGLGKAVVSEGEDGAWLTFTRGALPGAGSWRQEYAEPGNTTCSDDTHLACPLGVLWYGDPGPADMAERHTRPTAPLAANGRMFIQGEGRSSVVGTGDNLVMCYDAYNGLKLWERSLHGVLRTVMSHDGANAAVSGGSFFIAAPEGCLRLAAATGETEFTYKVPDDGGKARRWGYLSVVDDRIYGTRTVGGRTASGVFCLDVAAGAPQWTYKAEDIPQGAIAIGDGKLFLAHANVTPEQRAEALREEREAMERLTGAARKRAEEALAKADVRLIVALDARTGQTLWTRPTELTGAIGQDYWCSLGSIYKDGVLLLFGVYADGHHWQDFFAGKFGTRRVFALNAADGSRLWERHIGYRVRPIVVGDTLHAEPWAFDLRTGEQRMRAHPITGRQVPWEFARPGHHCGCPAAAPNLLLFRSYALGWYDLKGDFGTEHFGGLRTSCWINFIPANGVLMVPEGGSGCMCPFPTSCTVVFENRKEDRGWGYASAPGKVTPVRHLAINLGAPGDRRAPDGTLWFGYPRPGGSLVLQFPARASFYPGGGYFCHDPLSLQVAGSAVPWVCRAGIRGARSLVVPLIEAGDGAAVYTVRLTFAEVDGAQPGQRVFGIRVQGRDVARDVDVVREAGGPGKGIVREFAGIHVDDKLTIELTAKTRSPSLEQAPVLQGVEIVRERVLSVGALPPSFELADAKPEAEDVIRLANHTDGTFTGTLRVHAPDGYAITPAEQPVRLAREQTREFPIKASVMRKGEREKLSIDVFLVRDDGTTEWEGRGIIDYLGRFGRTVFKAVEDAWVIRKAPKKNYGKHPNLNIDGGNAKAGDGDHAIAYIKFIPAVPGKPVRSLLRLYNAGNPTGNSGEIRLLSDPWKEGAVTYNNRPNSGRVLATIGPVTEMQVVELPLSLTADDLAANGKPLSLAIVPTSNDGVNYGSREGGRPAELVVEYEPARTGNR